MLEGLRGEASIAALCRREGIAESLYYSWSKEFKKRLAGVNESTEPGLPVDRRDVLRITAGP